MVDKKNTKPTPPEALYQVLVLLQVETLLGIQCCFVNQFVNTALAITPIIIPGPQHDWARLRRHLRRGGQAQEILQEEGRAGRGSTTQRRGEWSGLV